MGPCGGYCQSAGLQPPGMSLAMNHPCVPLVDSGAAPNDWRQDNRESGMRVCDQSIVGLDWQSVGLDWLPVVHSPPWAVVKLSLVAWSLCVVFLREG
jgi:hypothetical protein